MWHRNKRRHFSSKRQNRSTRKMLAQHNSPARMIPESTSAFFSKNWARHRENYAIETFSLFPLAFLPATQASTQSVSRERGALCGRQTMMPFIPVKYWDPQLEVPLGKYVNPGWSQTMRRLTRIRLLLSFIHIHPSPHRIDCWFSSFYVSGSVLMDFISNNFTALPFHL